jgi:hypothetical protein
VTFTSGDKLTSYLRRIWPALELDLGDDDGPGGQGLGLNLQVLA